MKSSSYSYELISSNLDLWVKFFLLKHNIKKYLRKSRQFLQFKLLKIFYLKVHKPVKQNKQAISL